MLAKDIADRKPNASPSDLVAQGVGER
jgi:hypothetical protein